MAPEPSRRIEPSLSPWRDLPPREPELEPPRPRRTAWQRIRLTLLWLFLTLLLLALVPPGYVLWLRTHAPRTTAFMLQSEVQPVQYRWVPKEQIPDSIRQAAVAAEDQKFWTHWGFDFIAIAEALEHNEKSKKKRGASTITQQTAKNLFLWPSRSWLRKGLEVTFTLLLEALWPKERILEVYLNVAEFGPGIYGVEAASQRFFGKPAAKMTPAESALLIAVLPNPRKWRADRPGPYVQKRVDSILTFLGYRPRFSFFPEEVTPLEPGVVEGMNGQTSDDPGEMPEDEASELPPTTEEPIQVVPSEPLEPEPEPEAAPQEPPRY